MEAMHRTRLTAVERREEILNAAVSEFALKGLHGTSTETIAQRVGISQPYLFRLFGTKKGLFLAAVERNFDHVAQTFRLAAESNPENPLMAMGIAYKTLLTRREDLQLQMQAYVACVDPEVRAVVRRRFTELYELAQEVSGEKGDAIRDFFSHGMLLNVAAAMDLPSLVDSESWAEYCRRE